jgi:hypothetical protein
VSGTNFRFVVVCILLSCPTLRGQYAWKDADRHEIEKAWDSYNQAFIAKDYSKLRDLLQVPFVRWNDRETASLESLDKVIEIYRRLREALDIRGYKTSKPDLSDARISVLSSTRILLNIRFRRYKTDGSLLEEGAGVYLMSKTSGSWKIQGTLAQDPGEMGKVR